jgi:hypothetical protein
MRFALCESRPDPRDGLSAITALSRFEPNLSYHVSRALDDRFLAFWAVRVFRLVTRDVADVDIFKARG